MGGPRSSRADARRGSLERGILGPPRHAGEVWYNDLVQTPAIEEVGDNRVRLTVDVPAHDVKHAVEHATSDLSQSVKIPGFRQGKVPKQVLLQRVGQERLLTEAVESHIGGWFWNAAARTRLRPVSQPELRLRAAGHRRRRLALHGRVRRPAEARAAGLVAARGGQAGGDGSAGARRRRARRPPQRGRRARARGRPARAGRRHRSSSTS